MSSKARERLNRRIIHPSSSAGNGAESTTHYEPVPGQRFGRSLCSWEGGGRTEETDGPVTCRDCLAIYRFFRPGGDK